MQDHIKLKSQQKYVYVAETVLGKNQLFEGADKKTKKNKS